MAKDVGFGQRTCIGDNDADDSTMFVKGWRQHGKPVSIGSDAGRPPSASDKVGFGEKSTSQGREDWDDTRHMGVSGARAPFIQKGIK